MTNSKRYTFTAEAKAEAAEIYGEMFANSILCKYDIKDIYAPVGADERGNVIAIASEARSVFPDMLEVI